MPLSRLISAFSIGLLSRYFAYRCSSFSTFDEHSIHEPWRYRHGIFSETEVEVSLIPETLEPPGGAVVSKATGGPGEVTLDDAPGTLVQPRAPLFEPMEYGPGGGLVLGGAVSLPSTADHHDVWRVNPIHQFVGDGAGVYEGSGKDGGRARGGIHDASAVRGGEYDGRARRYLRLKDLRGRVSEVEAGDFRAPPLPDTEVRARSGRLGDRGYRHYASALGDEYRDGRAGPESVHHDDSRTGAGGGASPILSTGVACDHAVIRRDIKLIIGRLYALIHAHLHAQMSPQKDPSRHLFEAFLAAHTAKHENTGAGQEPTANECPERSAPGIGKDAYPWNALFGSRSLSGGRSSRR